MEEQPRFLIDLRMIAANVNADGRGEAAMSACVKINGDLNHVVRMLAAVLQAKPELLLLLEKALKADDTVYCELDQEEFKRAFE